MARWARTFCPGVRRTGLAGGRTARLAGGNCFSAGDLAGRAFSLAARQYRDSFDRASPGVGLKRKMPERSASTAILPAAGEAIRQAARVLWSGGLVALPTETVYGLGAAAEDPRAVAAMFAAKGRPADHPVIVHLGDAAQLDQWAIEVPAAARKLAAAFWPGPLTMILRRSARASDLVTGGLETVGLRVPAHPVALELLREFGGAIAAPSANRFGRVSPTTAQHVHDELAGRIDLILDGGPCQVGLESTIVDLSRGPADILRPGGITAQQVREVLGPAMPISGPAPRVSGSLESHYAPQARVELLSGWQLAARARELVAVGQRIAILARPSDIPSLNVPRLILPLPNSDRQCAQELYALLREADAQDCDVILATLPAEEGLGAAIADRLRKAAGTRDCDPRAPVLRSPGG